MRLPIVTTPRDRRFPPMCHTNERMARRVARVSYLERGWGKGWITWMECCFHLCARPGRGYVRWMAGLVQSVSGFSEGLLWTDSLNGFVQRMNGWFLSLEWIFLCAVNEQLMLTFSMWTAFCLLWCERLLCERLLCAVNGTWVSPMFPTDNERRNGPPPNRWKRRTCSIIIARSITRHTQEKRNT